MNRGPKVPEVSPRSVDRILDRPHRRGQRENFRIRRPPNRAGPAAPPARSVDVGFAQNTITGGGQTPGVTEPWGAVVVGVFPPGWVVVVLPPGVPPGCVVDPLPPD